MVINQYKSDFDTFRMLMVSLCSKYNQEAVYIQNPDENLRAYFDAESIIRNLFINNPIIDDLEQVYYTRLKQGNRFTFVKDIDYVKSKSEEINNIMCDIIIGVCDDFDKCVDVIYSICDEISIYKEEEDDDFLTKGEIKKLLFEYYIPNQQEFKSIIAKKTDSFYYGYMWENYITARNRLCNIMVNDRETFTVEDVKEILSSLTKRDNK